MYLGRRPQRAQVGSLDLGSRDDDLQSPNLGPTA